MKFIGHSKASCMLKDKIEQAKSSNFILLIGRKGMGITFTTEYLHEKFWEDTEIKPRLEEIEAKNAEPVLEKYLKSTELCTLCINGAYKLTADAQKLLISHFKNKHKNNDVKIILTSNERIKCSDNLLYADYFCENSVAVIEIPSLHERGIDDILLFINHFLEEEKSKRNKDYNFPEEARTECKNLDDYKSISLHSLQRKIELLCIWANEPAAHKTISADNVRIILDQRATTEEYEDVIDFWKYQNQQLDGDIVKYKSRQYYMWQIIISMALSYIIVCIVILIKIGISDFVTYILLPFALPTVFQVAVVFRRIFFKKSRYIN